MTHLGFRIRIRAVSVIIVISRIYSFCWSRCVLFLGCLLRLIVNQRQVEQLRRDAAYWEKIADSIKSDLDNLNGLTETRKTDVLAAKAAVMRASARLKVSASRLLKRAAVARTLYPSELYLENRTVAGQQRLDSLRGIVLRIEDDTFYSELLLWLVAPNRYDDAMFGDLMEEYVLRCSVQGEEKARAWRQLQLKMTLKDCMWKKFERLAAIGTLADLISRLFIK